ncbi:MAG: NAD(P)/FAD-dependent oxidoreductase [Halieaceae bacterium]|nr:NAD(P)/FAD-dependent oxidoreductase [Halieaceae bacterium]
MTNLETDHELLRKKYKSERDKRLRDEGNAQYVSVEKTFSEYADDPYIKSKITRDPLVKEVEVVVIGGGHGGILTAHSLRKQNIDDFCIIEKAGDFGGTWYWNRYPNCRCDVESYIYLPLIEEFGEMPTEKYARSSEIFEHAKHVARKLDLYPHALFQTTVTEVRWDADVERWIVQTDQDDVIKARFVALASGPLNRPKLPGIKGIEKFKGKAFHTSRWDYSYTGGDEKGRLTKLKNKKVAIIGTGASAIQAITALAEDTEHLYVVQRTPAAVEERNNYPTDLNWWKHSRPPGWWEKRARNFDGFSAGEDPDEDLVADGWTKSWAKFSAASKEVTDSKDSDISIQQLVDYEKMGAIRGRIENIVHDKNTAESLKPYYNWFCKRPLFHDGYYECFNQKNVTLIDTKGKNLDRISENAIEFEGQSFEVDCIIYASGFEAAAPSNRSGGFSLIGKNGVSIDEYWQEGRRTLHGMFVHGFPNLVMIHGIKQAATTWNGTYILTKHAQHFADLIKRCRDQKVGTFDIKIKAENAWLCELEAKSTVDLEFLKDCTPGYINNEGQRLEGAIYASTYGPGVFEYLKVLEKWRQSDLDQDMELTK